MRYNQIIIPILLSLFALTGCEKVIDIELDEAESTLVIEASLDAGTNQIEVLISTSQPYFSSESAQSVEDAVVFLRDESGNIWEVPHIANGRYEAEVMVAPERTYRLEVTRAGTVYEARSYLPSPVSIQQVETEYQDATAFTDAGYFLFLSFQDPAQESNYYRLIHSVNGVEQTDGMGLQVTDDQFFDGSAARLPLFQQTFDSGSEILLTLVHFDAASYAYFDSLADIIGPGQGPSAGNAAPGNPITNWNGGALGYFSAFSVDQQTITIP